MTPAFYAILPPMKKMVFLAILALVVMGFSSCGREKLTPIYKPMTINQLQKDRPVYFAYDVSDTEIKEYASNAGKFPLFGKLFRAIAIVLANTSITSNGGHELPLDAVDIDLSQMAQIDFALVSYIDIDSIELSVRNAQSKDSLEFITKLEIYAKLDTPVTGLRMDGNGYSRIVYYDSAVDRLKCDGHCIRLNVANINWKELIQNNKLVHLQPKLVINAVPVSTMKLAGSVKFSVKFNLGF